jgi:DNA-binding response OmpR family regulator
MSKKWPRFDDESSSAGQNGDMKVLIVEDDRSLADSMLDSLHGAAVDADHVATGRECIAAVTSASPPDVVVLDLGLPDMDGTDVCRALRAESPIPIIVVSARSEELDRVLALELGADDYLVKPFGMRELLARIRAVLRRFGASPALPAPPALGSLSIDHRGRRVTLAGLPVHLTPTEFDLLAYLAADPGAVRRRADILRDVWHAEWYGATKTLDAHVAALRRKLGSADWIASVRGIGFRFEAQS